MGRRLWTSYTGADQTKRERDALLLTTGGLIGGWAAAYKSLRLLAELSLEEVCEIPRQLVNVELAV